MEEAEALGVVDRLYDALGAFYAGGAEAPVRALLTGDVEWHVPGTSPIAGDYQGIDRSSATSTPAATWLGARIGCCWARSWSARSTSRC